MENATYVYVVDWELDQAERGLSAFTTFLGAAGVKFEPPDELRKLLETLRKSRGSPVFSPREMFVHQLMTSANKSLEGSGDARRLLLESGTQRWQLLTPEAAERLKSTGVKLERAGAPGRRALWSLASVPVALGTYVVASRLLRAQGLNESVSWLIALAVWFAVRQLLNRTLLRAR